MSTVPNAAPVKIVSLAAAYSGSPTSDSYILFVLDSNGICWKYIDQPNNTDESGGKWVQLPSIPA